MQASYPGFICVERSPHEDLIARREAPRAIVERTECHNPVRTWRGKMQPFASDSSPDEVDMIIADLRADREVDILNGTLHHAAQCVAGDHRLPESLRPRRRLDDEYTVEIACRIPPAHPIVRALDPLIILEMFGEADRKTLHLLESLHALCILFPSDGRWHWDGGDGIRDYADQTAIWLTKYTVWRETRDRLGSGRGQWIGASVRHGELEMLRRLCSVDQCYCGRGSLYGSCCQPEDVARVLDIPERVFRRQDRRA